MKTESDIRKRKHLVNTNKLKQTTRKPDTSLKEQQQPELSWTDRWQKTEQDRTDQQCCHSNRINIWHFCSKNKQTGDGTTTNFSSSHSPHPFPVLDVFNTDIMITSSAYSHFLITDPNLQSWCHQTSWVLPFHPSRLCFSGLKCHRSVTLCVNNKMESKSTTSH